MRSPKAVNRSHSHHVFSVNSTRGKGEAAKRRLATKKKWQLSLLGLNPYATKAAIVFATFDLKVAEVDRLNKFSDEQQAEKSSTSAQMKAEKELQNKAKKEREATKKQQKQERKKIADAARKEEEEKLAKSNVATHLTKESENKNSTNTCEPFSEESIKNLSKESSKKNKKNKKKFESDSYLVNEEVMVARNIEPTETPKNTPVDTPAEAPTTPAEETHSKRKAKKRKSESSGGSPEHKTEKHNEEYDFDIGKVPMVSEEVNVELDKAANNMNTTQTHSVSETTKEGLEQTTSSVAGHIVLIGASPVNDEEVVSETVNENESMLEKPVTAQEQHPTPSSNRDQMDSVNGAPVNVGIVVSETDTDNASMTEPVFFEGQQQHPTISSVSEHNGFMIEQVVPEAGIKNLSMSEESFKVEEQQHDPTSPSVADQIASTKDTSVIVQEVFSDSSTEKASMSQEPFTAKEQQCDPILSVLAQTDSVNDANVNVEEVVSEISTENVANPDESVATENVDAVNNKTDDEFEFVEHEEVQVCSSFNKSKKNKRNKKKSHTEPSSAAHAFSSTPVPEEHATTEDTTEPTHTIIDERDQQNNSRVSELEYSSVIPDNKETVNVMNQVISTTKDELDKIVQDAPKTIAPIQVNEVTSTETDSDGQKIYRGHISAAVELDSVTNPTHFAQNVQKLVNSTLSASNFDLNDPNMKMTVQAQLVKITEKEKKPTIVYEHKPITLAYERQRTVFERPTRERIYKLLNRDIVFCSSMIDVYGEDYESMAKDEKNVYRETARSIQRKIRIFKESPHYSVYLEAKALGKDVSELLSEETL